MRTCAGCGGLIHDQFILQVAPNLEWHAACLKCSQCHKFLDEKCTCFVRDGKCFCLHYDDDRPSSLSSATPLLTRAPAGHDIINYHKCKQCQSQSQQLYKTYNSVVTEQGGVRCGARGAYHSLLKK